MNRAQSSSSLKAKDSPEKPRRSVSILHLPDRGDDIHGLHRHSSVEQLPDLLRTGIRTGQKMSREFSEGVEGGLWRVASGDNMGLSMDLNPAGAVPAAVRSRSRGSRPGSHGNSRSGSRTNSRAPNSRIHSRSKLALNLDNDLDSYATQNVFLRTPGLEGGASGVSGNENSTFFIDATADYDSDDEEYDYVFNPNNDDEILLRTHIDRYDDDEESTSNFSAGLYRTFAKIMDKIAGIDDRSYDISETVVQPAGDHTKMLKVTSKQNDQGTITSRQARFLVRDEAQKQREDTVLILGAIGHVFT